MERIRKESGFTIHDDINIDELINILEQRDDREYYAIKILCKKECKIKAIDT